MRGRLGCGRLDAGLGEGPERRPDFEQVLREAADELVALALGALSKQHLELALERRHRALQPSAVSVLLELLPGAEQAAGYVGAPLAEFLLRGQPLGVGGEVSDQV